MGELDARANVEVGSKLLEVARGQQPIDFSVRHTDVLIAKLYSGFILNCILV